MKKKNKKSFKEKRKEFKEKMKNPRKKALFQLGCWMCFFLISYIIIILVPHPTPTYRSSSSNVNKKPLSNFQEMKSFEYVYTFHYDGKEEEIKGTYFEEQYYFTYLNQEYYANKENIYLVDSLQKKLLPVDNFIILTSLKELRKENLVNFLEEKYLIEKKEYKDGKKINTYQFPIEETKFIDLVVTFKDKYIEEIDINLKDYLESKQILYSQFQVNLKYSEINNLSSYSKNYSDYMVEGV